ncbi:MULTISPECIES: hypothetical protein [Planktothrix]|nr:MULTISPECIES: hypothetical protein [Planktothrix]
MNRNKNIQKGAMLFLTGLATVGLVLGEAVFSSASAAQQLFCNGRMNNGWTYSAQFLNGRFTEIRWERSGQPPIVSNLSFQSTNNARQPVYTGSIMAATMVTLVDLSRGNVRPGSQISVTAEEWGTSTGNCGLSSGNSMGNSSDWFTNARKNLIGSNENQARRWLTRNNFVFNQTMEHTNRRIIERWSRNNPNGVIDVIFVNNRVSDVVMVR